MNYKGYLVTFLFTIALCDSLKSQLQEELNLASIITGFSFSFGYIDKDNTISISSGPKKCSFQPSNFTGDLEPNDTMVLGSGTKPYTAVGIMQLVDQGKITLDDKAYKHADGKLVETCGKNMMDYFGRRANDITVGELIFMRSGLSDFEHGDLDY